MSLQIKSSLIKLNALVFTCAFMFNAQAGTLNSTLEFPQIEPDFASSVETNYDIVSGHFDADGATTQLTTGGVVYDLDVPALYTLDADIDTGNNSASGVITLLGEITSLSFNSGTLLTGVLAQIGGPLDTLYFLFDVTGGDAAALYGGLGSKFGVIMANSGYTGGLSAFDMAFASNTATSDTVAVPVPGTLALLLIGFGALGLRRNLQL